MLELAFLAGAASYVIVAAAIPFILLADLLGLSELSREVDRKLKRRERKRRKRREREREARAAAPPGVR